MVPGADPKLYEEVKDVAALVPTIEEYLSDYNAESKTPMKLVRGRRSGRVLRLLPRQRLIDVSRVGVPLQVMFLDAIEHVSRISRVLRQPQGVCACVCALDG
jgi:dynein heavy chain